MRHDRLAKSKEIRKRRKKEILGAAMKVFSRDGFHGTDVDEIAKLIDVGKGTIYNYFPTKEKLFFALVDKGLDELADAVLGELKEEDTPLVKTEKVVSAYLRFFEKHKDFYTILIHEKSEFQKRVRKKYMKKYFAYLNKIEEIFKEGIRKGQIRKMDVRPTVYAISELLNGFIYIWLLEGGKRSLTKQVPLIMGICFSGIAKT